MASEFERADHGLSEIMGDGRHWASIADEIRRNSQLPGKHTTCLLRTSRRYLTSPFLRSLSQVVSVVRRDVNHT